MSVIAETAPSAQIPPRHFWRRLFAFFIDVMSALLAFSLITLLLSKLPLGIDPVPFFNSTSCETVTSGPMVTRVEGLWALKPGETRTNQICSLSRIRPDQRLFVTSVSKQDGAATSTRFVSVLLDGSGVEVTEEPSGAVLLYNLGAIVLMAVIFAYQISKGGSTLGKKLLSLKVTDIGSGFVELSQALKREILKMLPILVIAAIEVALFYLSEQPTMSLEEKINFAQNIGATPTIRTYLPTILIGLVSLAWWVWPLVFWRGQTFYDRISNCRVVRQFYEGPRVMPRSTAV
jgi:uncharacterized RDD family membrane protein YckC